MTIRNLDHAFCPASIALIGASRRPRSIGRTVLQNLRSAGFQGRVMPVNPKYDEIDGERCFANIDALPEVPQLAVIATPAQTVPGLVEQLGTRGTRAAVVLSAGLTEDNGLRQAMLDAARPHTFRIIGPNCIGIAVPGIGLNASFAHLAPSPGHLAFLSQSGALVGAVLDWAASRSIGFSHVVSMGDMADVDVGDLLDYLAGDPETTAILLYLETVVNARKFMSAARSAARAKPVIVVKSGRHSEAAHAAATHTGALSGSDDVASAAFHRAGLLRVERLEDLFIAAQTLARAKPIDGDRLAILTNGGGAGVLAVDKLVDLGGTLGELSPQTISTLARHLPPNWSGGNPVDIIGDAGRQRYSVALETLLDDPGCDAVLVMACPTALAMPEDAADAVIEEITARNGAGKHTKPILTNWLGDQGVREARRRFVEAGIPTFETPADAVTGFDFLTSHRRAMRRTPRALPVDFKFDTNRARSVMSRVGAENRALLTDPEAKDVLAAYGIPTVSSEIAETAQAAGAAAEAILERHGSVAVKILSRDISHKSDVGGVRLNLTSVRDVEAAARAMRDGIHELHPDARIDGFTVQPMIVRPGAHELILGTAEDPIFGPVILFGAGGTAVEVINDKAVGLPPLDLGLARELIENTRIFALLKGYRDSAAVDLDALALTLVRLSQLVIDCPEVTSLDINPLLADADGLIVLDARVEVDPDICGSAAPNPRLVIRPDPKPRETSQRLRTPDAA